jgi:hypothetical protein
MVPPGRVFSAERANFGPWNLNRIGPFEWSFSAEKTNFGLWNLNGIAMYDGTFWRKQGCSMTYCYNF